jgi:hypothetical protein
MMRGVTAMPGWPSNRQGRLLIDTNLESADLGVVVALRDGGLPRVALRHSFSAAASPTALKKDRRTSTLGQTEKIRHLKF